MTPRAQCHHYGGQVAAVRGPPPTRLLALLVSGLGLASCAHAVSVPPAEPAPHTRFDRGAGPAVAVVPRAGVQPVRLSLWIDAGSRDADPPQLAVAAAQAAARQTAAQAAAQRTAPELRVEVLPDATRFELDCEPHELPRCATWLASVLATRTLAPHMLGEVRQWLADGRRRALAQEPARGAQRLALSALLGPDAAGLLPLGDAARDAELEPGRVQGFWAAHYGPSRALLVAVGDLASDDATLARLRAPLGAAPAATHVRAERTPLVVRSALEVGVDDRERLWLALGASSLARVQAQTEQLRRELVERRGLATHLHGQTFAVRGGAFALLELDGADQGGLVEATSVVWSRFNLEQPTRSSEWPAPDDLGGLAAQQAAAWLALDAPGSATAEGLGIGAMVAGGRADGLAEADPDAQARQRARERLQARFAAGQAQARPVLQGAQPARPAHTQALSLANGARIDADLGEGRRAALVVRFVGGAGTDPPALHGRSALLATLSSHACRAHGPLRLRDALTAIGAELEPWVDAQGWGLYAQFPAERWLEAIDLVLHCALNPALAARHVSSARRVLRERLDSVPARALALAAQTLAPLTPGALAPWGDADRLANVAPAELATHGLASRRGPRTRAALVGELPEAAIEALARRLAELPADAAEEPASTASGPAGSPASGPASGLAPEALVAGGGNAQRVQLTWQRTPGGGAAASQAFAALMAHGLRGAAGLRVRWHGGGEGPGLSWAALSLNVDSGALPGLAAQVAQVQAAIAPAALEAAARAVAEAEDRGKSAALGSALGRALRLTGAVVAPYPPDAPERSAELRDASLQLLARPPSFQRVGTR